MSSNLLGRLRGQKGSTLEDSVGVLDEGREAEAFQPYEVNPHTGQINELYHTHSNFSDGKDPFHYMVREAGLLDVDYFGITDHLDVTGISNEEHHDDFMGPFSENYPLRENYLNEAINDYQIDDWDGRTEPGERFRSVKIARGAEVDWDPREGYENMIKQKLDDKSFDYYLLSVHHAPDGKRFGDASDFAHMSDREKRKRVEDYFQYNKDAMNLADELDKPTVISHPSRIEKAIPEQVRIDDYYDLLDHAQQRNVAYELNGKVQLRHFLESEELTKGAEALISYQDELPGISTGTDTHRVGKSSKEIVDYRGTESQARLEFLEAVLDWAGDRQTGKPYHSVLAETEDLPRITVTVPEDGKIRK